MRMQQDAMRRVNEMQRLSRQKVGGRQQQGVPKPDGKKEENKPREERREAVPAAAMQSNVNFDLSTTFKGMLSRMKLDSDSVIIIMLLILFLNEGADSKLILALVYILI